MAEMYKVERESGELFFIAALPTIQLLLTLHPSAVARIEREERVTLYNTRPYGTVKVTFLAQEWQLVE